jgi:MoaA/NifB/PqqE/SkfB family radical SAM enzyme
MCPKSSSILGYYSHPLDMDYVQLEKLLIRNAKYISLVKLFGGEPLYHQKIIQIIELLDKLHLKYTITTNAYLLTPEICRRIIKNCVRICLSIDAVENNLYSQMRRGGDLNIVSQNIHMLNQIKIQHKSSTPVLKVVTTVFDFNLEQMPKMVEFCAKHQIPNLIFQEGVFYGNNGVVRKNLLIENIHLTEETIKQTREAGKQYHVKVEFDLPWFKQCKKGLRNVPGDNTRVHKKELRRCFYLYFTMLIQQNEKHTYCFGTYDNLEDINKRELSDIWNSTNDIYYKARELLKKNIIPDYCKKAYALGGKCALTMVVEESMLYSSIK